MGAEVVLLEIRPLVVDHRNGKTPEHSGEGIGTGFMI